MQSLYDLTSEKLAKLVPPECIENIEKKYVENINTIWIVSAEYSDAKKFVVSGDWFAEIGGIKHVTDGRHRKQILSFKKPTFEFFQSPKAKEMIRKCFEGASFYEILSENDEDEDDRTDEELTQQVTYYSNLYNKYMDGTISEKEFNILYKNTLKPYVEIEKLPIEGIYFGNFD